MKVVKSVDFTPYTFDPSSGPNLSFSSSTSVSTNGTCFDLSGIMVAATSNVPRIDYDPSNLYKAPKILLERTSTNQLLYSEDLTNAIWQKINCSIVSNSSLDLKGTSTMDKIVENTLNTAHYVVQNYNATETYVSWSFYITPAERTKFQISLSNNVNSVARYQYDLTTNSLLFSDVNSIDWSDATSSCVLIRDNIYLATLTVYKKSFNNIIAAECVILDSNGNNTWTGNGSSGFYAWGFQLETGTKTSYIPTTSATVTRTADTFDNSIYSNIGIPSGGDPPLWSSSTVYLNSTLSDEVIGTDYSSTTKAKRYDSLVPSWDKNSGAGLSISAASPCVVTWTAHGIPADTPIQFTNMSGGSLPTGLSFGTVYYVKSPLTDSFNLSTTAGGAAINTSGSASSGLFIGVASTNYNKKPETNPTYWLETLSPNRAKMFDGIIGTADDNIYDTVPVGNRTWGTSDGIAILRSFPNTGGINHHFVSDVCLLNTDCTSARVVAYTGYYTGNPTIIYDKTISGDDPCGILDMWAYFTEEITRVSNFDFADIPPYDDTVVSLCIYNYDAASSGPAYCGEAIFGVAKEFGALQANARLGVIDYTIKETDSFGNPNIVERGYSDKNEYTVWVESEKTASVKKLLNSYRAIPMVWIGDQEQQMTYSYGYYKDFSMILSYPTVNICNLEIEGLT